MHDDDDDDIGAGLAAQPPAQAGKTVSLFARDAGRELVRVTLECGGGPPRLLFTAERVDDAGEWRPVPGRVIILPVSAVGMLIGGLQFVENMFADRDDVGPGGAEDNGDDNSHHRWN